jgi:hypothetical protein
MKKLCGVMLIVAAVALGSASRLEAATIGTFSWDVELCSVFDPCFTVLNLADFDFLHVSVSLNATDGVHTLSPGSTVPDPNVVVPAGESLATLDDLSGLSITLAPLSLSFAQPGSVRLLNDTGDVVTGLTAAGTSALIDFVPDEPPSSVPEPGTLMLLGTGLVAVMAKRHGRR